MINAFADYILDCWPDFLPEHEKPNGLSFILVSDLPPHSGVVTFLVVPDGSPEPLMTAKIPRYITYNKELREKVECVRRLKQELPHHLSSCIPVMINLTEIEGRLLILEQPMPLPTLGVELRRRSGPGPILCRIEGFGLISDWLIDFLRATRQPATDQNLERLILPSVDGYANRFSLTSLQRKWLDMMRIALAQEKNIPHLAVNHTNLTPEYVTFAKEQPYIFNWENMERKGLPLLDSFHFLTCLALHDVHSVAEAKDGFQRFIIGSGNGNRLWTSWNEEISSGIGIDEPTRNLLYLLYLINRALNWNEFETAENYWPQLFGMYVSWLDQANSSLKRGHDFLAR